MFRGLKVGEVLSVDLAEDQSSIHVQVRLVGSARSMARSGSQFWIERPRLDLTEVRGLDTLLAGHYIAFQPGPVNFELARQFEGLADPPPMPREDGALEVQLDANERLGVMRGTPILYRGVEIGRVAHVALAKDSATVKITAIVDADFAELVRDNSRWWIVRGVQLKAGLGGLQLSMDSLSSLLRGGIGLATPPSPGKPVVTGHSFPLHAEPDSQWLEWQPRLAASSIPKGDAALPLPVPVRVVASWQSKLFGFDRRKSVQCWGLLLDDGTLAVPRGFVGRADLESGPVTLETLGQSWPLAQADMTALSGIDLLKLPEGLDTSAWTAWPVRQLEANCVGLVRVVNPELREPVAIDSTRLEQTAEGFRIHSSVSLASELEGSPVVLASSGKVFGLLTRARSGWNIAPVLPR
jgi:hypothetical protein